MLSWRVASANDVIFLCISQPRRNNTLCLAREISPFLDLFIVKRHKLRLQSCRCAHDRPRPYESKFTDLLSSAGKSVLLPPSPPSRSPSLRGVVNSSSFTSTAAETCKSARINGSSIIAAMSTTALFFSLHYYPPLLHRRRNAHCRCSRIDPARCSFNGRENRRVARGRSQRILPKAQLHSPSANLSKIA